MVECKIKPSIQGDLDNLCGIYSLVNIVAYLYDGRFKRRKLKFELLRQYKKRWQIDHLLEQGLDELEMDYLIESTFRQGFYQQHYPLTFTTPYRNQSPLRTTQIIKEMRQFLHDPNYELKDERSTLIRQNKILTSSKVGINYLSVVSDRNALEAQLKEIEDVKEQIANLRKARNTAINRKLKYEISIKEIKSLNRTIEQGELQCLDCGSTHIGFKIASKSTFSFDISTPEIRNDILESLNEKISSYQEEIEKITYSINTHQSKLQNILSEESVSLESLIAYKYDIIDVIDIEKKIIEIDNEIQQLNNELDSTKDKTLFSKEARKLVISNIVKIMNETYKKLDPTGNLSFDDLFTKKGTVYSGSEAIIFHLVRLYAIAKVLNHDYPIIVDSFRAEDLSSNKENTVLELFSDLNTQIIFTTTLKKEEYGKYDTLNNIHHIDFTVHTPSKMLKNSYTNEFINLIKTLSLEI